MTSKVTVEPAQHRIEVELMDRTTTTLQTEVLEPGSPPREFWIYQGRSISIREAESTAAAADEPVTA